MGIYKFYGNQEYKLMEWVGDKRLAMRSLKQHQRKEPECNWILKTGSYASFGGFDCKENRKAGYGVLVSLSPKSRVAPASYHRKATTRKSGSSIGSVIGRIFR